MNEEQMWKEVYNADGYAIADYLNGWKVNGPEIRSTQHGERVFVLTDDIDAQIFSGVVQVA